MLVTSSYQVKLWKLTGGSRRWCRRRTYGNFPNETLYTATHCTLVLPLFTSSVWHQSLLPASERQRAQRVPLFPLEQPGAVASAALASTSSMRA